MSTAKGTATLWPKKGLFLLFRRNFSCPKSIKQRSKRPLFNPFSLVLTPFSSANIERRISSPTTTHNSDTKVSFLLLSFSFCSRKYERDNGGVSCFFFLFGSELNTMLKYHNYPQPRMMILQSPSLKNVTLDILFLSQWLFYVSDFQCHIPWMIFWCKKTIRSKSIVFYTYKTIFIYYVYTYICVYNI